MFGIDGPEFLVILIVLIVVIGPKDLPKMMQSFGKAMARMRTTANQFRQQFDEAMQEAELDDLQKALSDITDLDPRKKLKQVFDPFRDVAKDVRSSLNITSSSDKTKLQTGTQEVVGNNSAAFDTGIDTQHATYDSAVHIKGRQHQRQSLRVVKVKKKLSAIKSTPGGVIVRKRGTFVRDEQGLLVKKRKTIK